MREVGCPSNVIWPHTHMQDTTRDDRDRRKQARGCEWVNDMIASTNAKKGPRAVEKRLIAVICSEEAYQHRPTISLLVALFRRMAQEVFLYLMPMPMAVALQSPSRRRC